MGGFESTRRRQPDSQTFNEKPSSPTSGNPENHTTLTQGRNIVSKSLPHNYKDIVKDADLDKLSTEELYQRLYSGVFIDPNKQKYWVDKESQANCFMLYAKSLSITWSDDTRFWKWEPYTERNGDFFQIAVLLNVSWLEVQGKLDGSMLTPGIKYEFVFEVMLREPFNGWEVPVNLKLSFPNGSQRYATSLKDLKREVWTEIVIGEFTSKGQYGEIEFSLFEYKGGKWKQGLVIKGVVIRPKTVKNERLSP